MATNPNEDRGVVNDNDDTPRNSDIMIHTVPEITKGEEQDHIYVNFPCVNIFFNNPSSLESYSGFRFIFYENVSISPETWILCNNSKRDVSINGIPFCCVDTDIHYALHKI